MVIFFITANAAGPVDLFCQYEPHELMGKSKHGKRPYEFGFFQQSFIQTISAPD
jgi:hypothetical protein